MSSLKHFVTPAGNIACGEDFYSTPVDLITRSVHNTTCDLCKGSGGYERAQGQNTEQLSQLHHSVISRRRKGRTKWHNRVTSGAFLMRMQSRDTDAVERALHGISDICRNELCHYLSRQTHMGIWRCPGCGHATNSSEIPEEVLKS